MPYWNFLTASLRSLGDRASGLFSRKKEKKSVEQTAENAIQEVDEATGQRSKHALDAGLIYFSLCLHSNPQFSFVEKSKFSWNCQYIIFIAIPGVEKTFEFEFKCTVVRTRTLRASTFE